MTHKTEALKEQIKAIRDEVKTAGEKQDAEAKTAVQNALSQLDKARKQVESHMESETAEDQAERKVMLQHLQTAATQGAAALKESGANMRTNIRHMLDTTEEILTKDV